MKPRAAFLLASGCIVLLTTGFAVTTKARPINKTIIPTIKGTPCQAGEQYPPQKSCKGYPTQIKSPQTPKGKQGKAKSIGDHKSSAKGLNLKLPKDPNIVVIMADDLSAGDLKAAIAKGVIPNLTKSVIQKGVSFNQAFVTSSLDNSSRTTLLTGLYSHNHQILNNKLSQQELKQIDGFDSLPKRLQAKGYYTGLVGKYLENYGQSIVPKKSESSSRTNTASNFKAIPSGWNSWAALMGSSASGYTRLNDNGKLIESGLGGSSSLIDKIAQRSIDFINQSNDRNPSQPFFLLVSPVKAANQSQAPRTSKDRFQSLGDVDNLVGQIVKQLKQTNDLKQTILIFTASDGSSIRADLQSGAAKFFPETNRIPLIMGIPGVKSAQNVNLPVLNNDLAPTIADFADVALKNTDGRSLKPLLTQPSLPSWRNYFLTESSGVTSKSSTILYTSELSALVDFPKKASVFYNFDSKSRRFIKSSEKPESKKNLENILAQLKSCKRKQCLLTENQPLISSTEAFGKSKPKAKSLVGVAATNSIVAENALPGNPPSEWDTNGAGDSTIQGFATQISVNKGETVRFKIKTTARNYTLNIYRMGYYGGMGARKVAAVPVSLPQAQTQPACTTTASTGLIDCGNWAESASWAVPANATSGVYIADVVRADTGGDSHIVFIVRDDTSTSDVLFQTSDTTWQAYNNYGGNSLYQGGPGVNPSRAYKVSYNRPFNTRSVSGGQDWFFAHEYPMIRWLEANGYDVSYFTGVDSDLRGNLIRNHKAFLSLGHDEYWSGPQRTNVETARNNGVHLAFFSGNEIYWKHRWEDNYRTLVSYKETFNSAKIDPSPTWTGTWRDTRSFNPEGTNPENKLTGTIFTVNRGTTGINVSAEDGKMRFWRNTSIANLAPGSVATLPDGVLGYEWDEDLDNGARPPGLFGLSETTVNVPERLGDVVNGGLDVGPGVATHRLTLYKHSSGALVFGAGTIQWSWGLDDNHDISLQTPGSREDVRIKQATVNLFADMGIQPATLQPGLVAATASTDAAKPASIITSPTNGTTVSRGNSVTISGTATDSGGGVVGGVEVSVDGGTTWNRATGRSNWTYAWTPTTNGSVTIKSRAIDDSGNLETPGAGVTVTVTVESRTCPCSIWDSTDTPTLLADSDTSAVELGVKFRSDINGFITGVRFYKSTQNTGTHIGNLWDSAGNLLARATFTSESASGWQQVNFSTPVAITANTTYIASYFAPAGRYSTDSGAFSSAGVDNAPLHALSNVSSGGNGVYRYGSTSAFPNSSFNSTNYWVDPVFVTNVGADTTPPTVSSTTPSNSATGVSVATTIKAVFSEAMDASTINTITMQLKTSSGVVVPSTVTYDSASRTATLTPTNPLAASTVYSATVVGGASGVKDLAGNAL
ncbi:MAG TPA: N,N-dimethylformamidase beta subunit family domain-containing protein, partial [Stenomitos sp.]